MLKYIKLLTRLFKKDNTSTISPILEAITETHAKTVYDTAIDYTSIPSAEVSCVGCDKPYLFIMDDIPETYILYSVDFKNIKRLYQKDVLNDFTLVKCLDPRAGLMAHKYCSIENGKVDYAILDITLGYIVKLQDGAYVEFDGVDIAILILDKNPNAKILFSTAHTMNRRNADIMYYINKFETVTGLNINNYYMNKNSDRVSRINSFLYE
jgi:hypothetical protein